MKFIIYLMVLITLPINVKAENTFSIGKSEYFDVEQSKEVNIVKEKDLEYILKIIYEDFRKEEIEIFPEGLQFDIMSAINGSRMGYSNFGTISYYALEEEWEEKILYFVTMHEMGHMFKNRYFTREDFKEYLKIRNITLETFMERTNEMKTKHPHLTENEIFYLLSTEEMLAEDFRMIFSNNEFNTKGFNNKESQFLWEVLTDERKEVMKKFFIDILKRERTEEQAMEIIVKNATTHYGTLGD